MSKFDMSASIGVLKYYAGWADKHGGKTIPAGKQVLLSVFLFCFVFSIWVFFHEHSRTTGLQEKEEGISLTPHYNFNPRQRHLDIRRAIAAESSPLHIVSSRT